MLFQRLPRILSGGQTGVDRAALDAAMTQGFLCGGWCPRGRRAEDGRLPDIYPLRETPTTAYAQRTRWNVRDADITLVLALGSIQGGTAYTLRVARALHKRCRVLDLQQATAPEQIARWLRREHPEAVNIAGPRESQRPGIYTRAYAFLSALFARLRASGERAAR